MGTDCDKKVVPAKLKKYKSAEVRSIFEQQKPGLTGH
jgi:hypothetical protein